MPPEGLNADKPAGRGIGFTGGSGTVLPIIVAMEKPLKAEAIGILREVLEWRLPRARWEQVERRLEDVAGALAEADPAKLRKAVYALELSGPERAARIEDVLVLAPPPPTRERVGELVHRLESSTEAPPAQVSSGREDDASAG